MAISEIITAIKPPFFSSLPTFGPTTSTLLISKFPVSFKIWLIVALTSFPSDSFDPEYLIVISSLLPNSVTLAPFNSFTWFSLCLISSIGALLSYFIWIKVPPEKSIPNFNPWVPSKKNRS